MKSFQNVPVIALIGNPNCGKTALFNTLTGARQKVANYPGVTVEQKKGSLITSSGQKALLLDLPGTYSLRARSTDEEITRDVALGQFKDEVQPDVFLCVANATNLHLGLRLVLELKKIGKPIIFALNMMDISKNRGYDINIDKLSAALGVPVVPTIAISKNTLAPLLSKIDNILRQHETTVHNPVKNHTNRWSEPTVQDIRQYHKDIEHILKISHRIQGQSSRWTERLDRVFLNPIFGLVLLFLILFTMFQAVFSWANVPKEMIENSIIFLQNFLSSIMHDGPFKSLLIDGILAGVGSILVFIPQILILFFFILLLEDSGYMARAAFLMDKFMGSVGLNGKAFIPLLSSHACAVPGIMATRTIENKHDRLITILIAPLMACSARLPVYTLIISAFIPAKNIFGLFNLQGVVLFCLYACGILSALFVAWLSKILFHTGQKPFFLLELPCYKIPHLRNIILGLWERAKIFLIRAGSIILALMILIWFFCSYPTPSNHSLNTPIQDSFAGIIGKFIAPLFAPIGFNWQISIAIISGFAAREVAIATLGTIYALSGVHEVLTTNLSNTLSNVWTLPTALSFLAWYVFAPQCVATLAVTKRETNSWLWPTVMFVYMLVFAYGFAWIVYHVSSYFM